MESIGLVQIFPVREIGRTHSQSYGEDRERSRVKICTKMMGTACIRASYAPIQKEEMI